MPRFFTPPIQGELGAQGFQALIAIEGEDAAHMVKSLRMREGDSVTLCDGSGFDYEGVIDTVGVSVTVRIKEKIASRTEPRASITLYQALPKGDKMEFIIQKSVELGVKRIVPVLTEFCVSRPDEKSMSRKRERYQKIAHEAAKQCGRGILPMVEELVPLPMAAEQAKGNGIVFYEKGGARLNELVGENDTELSVFVGSEGGFSPEEIKILTANGVRPATLGPRILRCETAPVCGLAIIQSLLGDI